jgi:hypothetical protein
MGISLLATIITSVTFIAYPGGILRRQLVSYCAGYHDAAGACCRRTGNRSILPARHAHVRI